MPLKLTGGIEGHCAHCARPWGATDGMPTAVRDRYTIRDKVQTLLKLSKGESYRSASQHIRAPRGVADISGTSRDGRLARDWVSQYAPILREEYLEEEWPQVLLLDLLPFRLSAKNGGQGSSRSAFYVFAALSYGDGQAGPVLEGKKRTPVLWRLSAAWKKDAETWVSFLAQLDGEPHHVICDQGSAMVKAVRWLWPNADVYACEHHLELKVRDIFGRYGLMKSELREYVDRYSLFGGGPARRRSGLPWNPQMAWLRFRRELKDFVAENRGQLSDRAETGLYRLEDWLKRTDPVVAYSLPRWHRPRSTGALETRLGKLRQWLHYRRHVLKNMERLKDLLLLMQLQLNHMARADQWQEVLLRYHQRNEGQPPARRIVDGLGHPPP